MSSSNKPILEACQYLRLPYLHSFQFQRKPGQNPCLLCISNVFQFWLNSTNTACIGYVISIELFDLFTVLLQSTFTNPLTDHSMSDWLFVPQHPVCKPLQRPLPSHLSSSLMGGSYPGDAALFLSFLFKFTFSFPLSTFQFAAAASKTLACETYHYHLYGLSFVIASPPLQTFDF